MPLQVTRRTRPASSSKSASQIQETSRPSAILSLSTPEQVVLAGLERERAQHLVGAGRVLDQQDPQLAPAGSRPGAGSPARARARERDRLGAPERGLVLCRPATMLASGTSSAVASAAAASAL